MLSLNPDEAQLMIGAENAWWKLQLINEQRCFDIYLKFFPLGIQNYCLWSIFVKVYQYNYDQTINQIVWLSNATQITINFKLKINKIAWSSKMHITVKNYNSDYWMQMEYNTIQSYRHNITTN